MITLEICVDDAEGLHAAISGGADRIELCSALALGGLTPSAGLMVMAAASPVPVYAMIRPRAGDFRYSAAETAQMMQDIDAARHSGLAGVVFGANDATGRLDEPLLRQLSTHADGLGRTLHRAIDLVPDDALADAVALAIDLGFERILTSGGAQTAAEGLDRLQRSFALAEGRIMIMPGAGVTAASVSTLLHSVPVVEIHASCSQFRKDGDAAAIRLGFATRQRRITSAAAIKALKAALA